VTSANEAEGLPEVPTIAESGLPGYDRPSGTAARAGGTARAIVARLHDEIVRALRAPEVMQRLAATRGAVGTVRGVRRVHPLGDRQMGQGRARRRNPLGMNLRCALFAFLAGVGCSALPRVIRSARSPDRSSGGGSATDTVARILAAELAERARAAGRRREKPGGALTIGLDFTRISARRLHDRHGAGGGVRDHRHMVAKLPMTSSGISSRSRS